MSPQMSKVVAKRNNRKSLSLNSMLEIKINPAIIPNSPVTKAGKELRIPSGSQVFSTDNRVNNFDPDNWPSFSGFTQIGYTDSRYRKVHHYQPVNHQNYNSDDQLSLSFGVQKKQSTDHKDQCNTGQHAHPSNSSKIKRWPQP